MGAERGAESREVEVGAMAMSSGNNQVKERVSSSEAGIFKNFKDFLLGGLFVVVVVEGD